jgi:catechol 2,3-dioxygenase-like lactoylglutathione lyase family enzyme
MISLSCRDVAAQEGFYAKHFGFQRWRTFNAGKPAAQFLTFTFQTAIRHSRFWLTFARRFALAESKLDSGESRSRFPDPF